LIARVIYYLKAYKRFICKRLSNIQVSKSFEEIVEYHNSE